MLDPTTSPRTYWGALYIGLSVTIIPTLLLCLITMPFLGALVRFRANYVPKSTIRLLTDGEEAAPSERSPSYFGMLFRVYRLEGWAGFYKGLLPYLAESYLAILIVTPIALSLTVRDITNPPAGKLPLEVEMPLYIISSALMVVVLPFEIVLNRAITTTAKLPWSLAPRPALKTLLSASEYANPLKLYLTPGLVLAEVIRGALTPLIIFAQRHIERAAASRGLAPLGEAALLVGLGLVFVALQTPVSVMHARLTLQRRGAPAGESELAFEPGVGEAVVMGERSGAQDGVAPYTSFVDCARKMRREEGLGVFARGWWIVALQAATVLLSALVTRWL
ncbi:unnamed protein product [Mycena citricolor]|uniref:Mitochondrial carrier n=1 Tax=Mycena citricolor TaxID=2018698 RepID=A0AAD2K7H8_9AGAR|nr:unnamed protein product [Mycena citricolor]